MLTPSLPSHLVSFSSQLGRKEDTFTTGDLYSGLVTRISRYLNSRYLRDDYSLGLLPSSLRSGISSSMFYKGVVVWAWWVLGCMGE